MNVTYYGENQLDVILPYLPRPPQWLVLGGPADGNEAQRARHHWPGIKIVACDPNAEAVAWQRRRGKWPTGALLFGEALSDKDGQGVVAFPPGKIRNGTMDLTSESARPDFPRMTCHTVTVDTLDRVHGPITDGVLWLDIEGWELEAVRGAEEALARGAFLLVNVEMQTRNAEKNRELQGRLEGCGFRAVRDWNDSEACRDRVFARVEG